MKMITWAFLGGRRAGDGRATDGAERKIGGCTAAPESLCVPAKIDAEMYAVRYSRCGWDEREHWRGLQDLCAWLMLGS